MVNKVDSENNNPVLNSVGEIKEEEMGDDELMLSKPLRKKKSTCKISLN